MKKERVDYLVDSFVDEAGNERHFVIAALSKVILPSVSDTNAVYDVTCTDDYDMEYCGRLVKCVKLGWAICNPIDKFNPELGKTIALGRARRNAKVAIYVTELGYVNTKLVKAFLEQEAEYFKKNPERYIAGYKREV